MKYLAGILLFTLTLAAQDWRYDQLPVTGQAPPARIDGTISCDRDSANLFLFASQAIGFFSDVWAYDIAANSWSRLAIDGAGHSNRYAHSAVLDEETNRMIIFYGFTDSGRFDDTWAFDLRINRWTEITGGVQPAARQHYGISFDTRRMQLILFGGSGRGTLSDTWAFNPQTRTWNQLNTSGPTARLRHQGAYAAERGATYFFGGSTNNGPTSELWQLRSGLTNLPRLATGGVTNAFSGIGGALAAGEYISIFGDSLSPDPQITLNGTPVPAFFAQSNQINLQVPTDLAATGEATIKVTREGESSNELKLPIVPAHPGLFPTGVNEDNTLNSATSPAARGAIIVFYATGQGSNPTQVALEIGGQRAELLFAATSPGAAGLMQINARIPTSLPTGPAIVKLRIGEAESQPGVQLFLR